MASKQTSAKTPRRPVVVKIKAAEGLPIEVVRDLSRDLLHAGTHGLTRFELIALKHLGSSDLRVVIESIETSRTALLRAKNRFDEEQAYRQLADGDRRLNELMAQETDAVNRAKALVAEMHEKQLLQDVADDKVRPCPGFPFRYVA